MPKVKRRVGKKKKKVLPKKDLTKTGFSIILIDGTYKLVTLKYDLETKQAYVAGITDFADSRYRADFELKKMMAHGDLIQEETNA